MGREKFPSAQLDQYMVRFPDGMRDRLKGIAARNNRSLNAEIVSRLERFDSLGGETDAMWEVASALGGAIDDATNETAAPLSIKINDAFDAVDEYGHFDRSSLALEFGSLATSRLRAALAKKEESGRESDASRDVVVALLAALQNPEDTAARKYALFRGAQFLSGVPVDQIGSLKGLERIQKELENGSYRDDLEKGIQRYIQESIEFLRDFLSRHGWKVMPDEERSP